MGRAERRIAWATAYRLIGLAGFIAAWSVAAYVAGNGRLLPSPLGVAAFLWREAADGEMLRQLSATLARVVAAFVLAMTTGRIASYLMGRSARLNALVDPVLVIALNLPI